MRFRDRDDAGRQLADALREQQLHDPLILALPRGGVPVAAPVAATIGAPLEAFVALKVAAPGRPELGIGAIAEDGPDLLKTSAADGLGVSPEQMRALADDEREELRRRVLRYRGSDELPTVRDRDVVLVDDGLATGVTAEAALRALRRHGPRRLILAVPVCAPDAARRLGDVADLVVCLYSPPDFGAVGRWYDEFGQTSDAEVLAILGSVAGGPQSSEQP